MLARPPRQPVVGPLEAPVEVHRRGQVQLPGLQRVAGRHQRRGGQGAVLWRQRPHRDPLRDTLREPGRHVVVAPSQGHVGQLVAEQPVAGGVLAAQHPGVQRHPDTRDRREGVRVVDRHRERHGVHQVRVAPGQLLQRRHERGVGQRVEHHPMVPVVGHDRTHVGDGPLRGVQQLRGPVDAPDVEDTQDAGHAADLHRAAVPRLSQDAVALLPLGVGHRRQPQAAARVRREEVAVARDDRLVVVPLQLEVDPHHDPVGPVDPQDVGGVEGVAEDAQRQLAHRGEVRRLGAPERAVARDEAGPELSGAVLTDGDGSASKHPGQVLHDPRGRWRRRGRQR